MTRAINKRIAKTKANIRTQKIRRANLTKEGKN
jgi:hypothetical protein